MGKQRAHRADMMRAARAAGAYMHIDPKAGEVTPLGKNIGKTTRELRKASGLTQTGLGLKANMSQAEISKIENGDVRTGDIEPLAKAFKISVNELLFDCGSKAQSPEEKEREKQIRLLNRRLRKLSKKKYDKVMKVLDAVITTEEED